MDAERRSSGARGSRGAQVLKTIFSTSTAAIAARRSKSVSLTLVTRASSSARRAQSSLPSTRGRCLLRVNENATTLDQIKVAGAALSVDDALDALLKTHPPPADKPKATKKRARKRKDGRAKSSASLPASGVRRWCKSTCRRRTAQVRRAQSSADTWDTGTGRADYRARFAPRKDHEGEQDWPMPVMGALRDA